VVGQGTGLRSPAFRSRRRSVRRGLQQLHRLAWRQGAAAAEPWPQAYERLSTVVRKTPAQAVSMCPSLRAHTVPSAQRLVRPFEPFLPRVERVINQRVRRVRQGEVVPAPDKLVSLFEPHPQSMIRRKTGKAVEFGRKVWWEDVEGGLSSGDRILAEAGQDFP
jgi:transposase, IS5 family